MTETLCVDTRRTELEQEAARQRDAAAAALEAGEAFDYAALDGIEREMQTLEELELKRQRDARAAADAAMSEQLETLRSSASDTFTSYQQAQQRAEAATRDLAAAIRDIRSASAGLTQLASAQGKTMGLTGGVGPIERRLSERIMAVLRLVTGHPAGIGIIEFHGGQSRDPDEDWANSEGAIMAAVISNITAEQKNADTSDQD